MMGDAIIHEAIGCAHEAVAADERADLKLAVDKYTQSVGLIQRALPLPRHLPIADAELQRYLSEYASRVTVLQSCIAGEPNPDAGAPSAAGCAGSSKEPLFRFEELEAPPAFVPAPAPADEWRRPFWLMSTLRASMTRGAFLTPDKSVYVPRRVWTQKHGKIVAMAAKLDCAETLASELRQVRSLCKDEGALRQPHSKLELERALGGVCDLLDSLQNSLARQLPFISELADKGTDSFAVAKMKGIAKSLDRTVGRLGTAAKSADPSEYVQTLVDLFDSAAFVEVWLDYVSASPTEFSALHIMLQRVASFLFQVVVAFVLQDLNSLLSLFLKKAAASFARAPS